MMKVRETYSSLTWNEERGGDVVIVDMIYSTRNLEAGKCDTSTVDERWSEIFAKQKEGDQMTNWESAWMTHVLRWESDASNIEYRRTAVESSQQNPKNAHKAICEL